MPHCPHALQSCCPLLQEERKAAARIQSLERGRRARQEVDRRRREADLKRELAELQHAEEVAARSVTGLSCHATAPKRELLARGRPTKTPTVSILGRSSAAPPHPMCNSTTPCLLVGQAARGG